MVRQRVPIDLFSLYILFSQCRSCDVTLESCFFEIASYSRAYVRIIYEDKRKIPLGTSHDLHWENKNVQAKEVYRALSRGISKYLDLMRSWWHGN